MQAMILAAGKGERMRPLTDRIPKPMVLLAGKPLLQYQVELLRNYGIKDLCINLHHHGEQIERYFGGGGPFGVHIRYSYESELMGTAGAVKKVEDWFKGSFLVLYADNLLSCPLDQIIEWHRQNHAQVTIGCVWLDQVRSSGILQFNADHRIERFLEKPASEGDIFSHWVNAGLYVVEPEIISQIPLQQPYDFGKDLFPSLLAAGFRIYAWPLVGYFLGIDTSQRREKAEKDIMEGKYSQQ